ncbi:hypothetical protein OG800_50665 (plasmid) [Streptomyces sp. NBC_00445]|uniref:hypothetical protein n=1 Tax=Streptomyces sp. NBC_00445 TaxID=2975745 RepID=UPI002E1FE60A
MAVPLPPTNGPLTPSQSSESDLTNTTFRRRYPEIAREIADHRATPAAPRSGPTEQDRPVARNAKLRRRNRELTTQLALAAAQIQHLALHNERLQEALEEASNVTSINSRTPHR